MRTTRCQRLGLLLLLASTLAVVAVCAPPRYNSVLGTTSIGSLYQFTRLPMLEETGQRIAAMGSSAIKVFVDGPDAGWQSVLSLPFTHIFLWYRTDSTAWRDGLSAQAAAEEYKLTFEFARSLLLNYSGAGRTFFVGQWEVDWELLPGYNLSYTPTPQSVQGLIDYLTVRQAAVDDARRLVPHAAVDVRCYTEVNRVVDVRLQPNLTRVVNAVLPHVRLDAVSYSAYDVQQAEQADVNLTLDYIAQHFNSSSTELFIGEFALPAAAFNYDGVQHAEANLAMARKFLSWRGSSGEGQCHAAAVLGVLQQRAGRDWTQSRLLAHRRPGREAAAVPRIPRLLPSCPSLRQRLPQAARGQRAEQAVLPGRVRAALPPSLQRLQ